MAQALVRVGTDTNNRPALLAPVAAHWWRLFAHLVWVTMGLRLEIIQAKGNYVGSGETHADGYAIDLRTWRFTRAQTLAIVALARALGASATWYRLDVGSGPHIHLVIDMGSMLTASSYQTRAVRAGYNGLGYLGRKAKDPHPAPARWLTAEAGILEMKHRLDQLEKDMPLTDDEINRIADAAAKKVWLMTATANGKKDAIIQHLATMTVDTRTAATNSAAILRKVK